MAFSNKQMSILLMSRFGMLLSLYSLANRVFPSAIMRAICILVILSGWSMIIAANSRIGMLAYAIGILLIVIPAMFKKQESWLWLIVIGGAKWRFSTSL